MPGAMRCGLYFVFHPLPILAVAGWCGWSVYLAKAWDLFTDPISIVLLVNIVAFAFLAAIPITLITFGISQFILGAALRIYIERPSFASAVILLAALVVSAPLSFLCFDHLAVVLIERLLQGFRFLGDESGYWKHGFTSGHMLVFIVAQVLAAAFSCWRLHRTNLLHTIADHEEAPKAR